MLAAGLERRRPGVHRQGVLRPVQWRQHVTMAAARSSGCRLSRTFMKGWSPMGPNHFHRTAGKSHGPVGPEAQELPEKRDSVQPPGRRST